MTKERIALIGLGALASIFFIGWVLPDFPYARRLSISQVSQLLSRYKELYDGAVSNNYVSDAEAKEILDIRDKVVKAGYVFSEIVDPTTKKTIISVIESQFPYYIRKDFTSGSHNLIKLG